MQQTPVTDKEILQAGDNPLVPIVCKVTEIRRETPDVKTFRVQTPDGGKAFDSLPGQLAMLSLFGVGEGMFSVTAQSDEWMEFSIKRTGMLTDALHEITEGQTVGLRGPYGNYFPIEEAKGKDLLFVGGGIGLAPLRSFIRYAQEHREEYGQMDILYGCRCCDEFVYREELMELWPEQPHTHVHTTVDRGSPGWTGNVGFVPPYLEECAFAPDNRFVVVCGPPIMINLTLQCLERMGFADEQIYTTLEMRMQCGIGKCGRCNIGSKYVCLDGPVFSRAQLRELPGEV